MPKTPDPLDDLPILDPGAKLARREPIPPVRTFKAAIAKVTNLHRPPKPASSKRGLSARGGHPNRGSQAAAVRPAGLNSRRVIVKARYVKQVNARSKQSVRLHLKYIEREGVNRGGGKGELYNATEQNISADDFLERSSGDPHQFRFIVSPEDAAELDLTAYTRDLMHQVETDLGRELDWVAVNHYNTDDPHTHIVIRGRDLAVRELRIDREYISHGFRDRARELATRELGPRLEHEIERTLRREIDQARFTSLDAQIARVSHANILDGMGEGGYDYSIDLGAPGEQVPLRMDRYVVGRLNALKEMGLAAQGSHTRSYALQDDWKAQLRALGERDDIYKRLSKISREAREQRIFDPETELGDVVGRLTAKGAHDELNDRYYAVVDDKRGVSRYVQLPKHIDISELPEGGIVRVRSLADPWRKPADGVIEDFARAHNGIYDRTAHAKALAASDAFMARGIDPEDYAMAHARRAVRLVRFGLLQRQSEGRFRVPEDLAAQQAALERDRPQARSLRIQVLDARPIEAQASAQGPTWLDTQGARDEIARNGFGQELSTALSRRAAFLQTLGIADHDPDKLQKLQRLERTQLADGYAAASGKALRALKPQETQRGLLKTKLVAPSGKAFGLFETEHEFSLVPWRERWQPQLGRQMAFGMNAQGVPFARTLGRELKK